MIALTINGAAHETDADPTLPLLWFLRDKLGLTGTKYGCGTGACGACTVLVDGMATRSCSVTLQAIDGAVIRTIESINDSEWDPVQEAWLEKQVPQCGYCQSGMIMATVGLLTSTPNPSPEQIRENLTNLCRCGTYQRVEAAVLLAAEKLVESRREAIKAAEKRRVARKRQRQSHKKAGR